MLIKRNCLVLVIVALCAVVGGTVEAEEATTSLSVLLEEIQYNIQFVVTGRTDGQFEADLIAPDGTRYNHQDIDAAKALYFKLDQARSWLLNEAEAGEYRVEITGSMQVYDLTLERELRRPSTTLLSPAGSGIVTLEGDAPLQLVWETTGDVEAGDLLRIYVKPEGGWQRIPVGQAALESGSTAIPLSGNIHDGRYELVLIADNKTASGQLIEPGVMLNIRGGVSYEGLQAVSVERLGPQARIVLKAINDSAWTGVTASLQREGMLDRPLIVQAARDELFTYTLEEEQGVMYYEWDVSLPENGVYNGYYQTLYDSKIGGALKALPSFEVWIRDWSQDKVVFLQEAEQTNLERVGIGLTLQADSLVQVTDGETLLFDEELSAAGEDGPETVIRVPLRDGERLLQVFIGDSFGNLNVYSKLYRTDFTPPRLMMIQPLNNHTRLEGNFASGIVEKGSVIVSGGKVYQPDEDGYFRIDGVGSSLDLIVQDGFGNETRYQWKGQGGRFPWMWPLAALTAGGAALAGWHMYLRKRP